MNPEPATRTATRVWYGDDPDVYTDYEIVGGINGYWDDDTGANRTTQIPNVTSARKIEIGSTVMALGDWVFLECGNLRNITLTNIRSIGEMAFMGCGLTNITIPSSVLYIGYMGFADCRSLTNMTIENGL